ncbi:unnamed protein product [Pleuronectes platessa]|uniref:Uncharacterized protein n=1 Tax=Pleuronectes platessa TaxID=8262 RepID=A0A9N7V7D0_PLEPL|nr:unnamed protein product [Pleuronectes platessa]
MSEKESVERRADKTEEAREAGERERMLRRTGTDSVDVEKCKAWLHWRTEERVELGTTRVQLTELGISDCGLYLPVIVHCRHQDPPSAATSIVVHHHYQMTTRYRIRQYYHDQPA